MTKRTIIGRNTTIEFIGIAEGVPAKVDTGADGSAVWASHIFIDDDHQLHFQLFDETSSLYTGQEVVTSLYAVASVRSSNGHDQIRYRTRLSVRIAGRRIRANFTLADRSTQQFPVLIGRRTLRNRFIVDVAREDYTTKPRSGARYLTEELRADPKKFHNKYYDNTES